MPNDPDHTARVQSFRTLFTNSNANEIVATKLLSPGSFALSDEKDASIRQFVSGQFNVPAVNVAIVSSGKLGFSISKKYKGGLVVGERYRPFTEKSDIDIALICPTLFDQVWEETFRYMNDIGPWAQLRSFEKYFFRGWIRPDKLPRSPNFRPLREWDKFFGDMSRNRDYTNHRISAGLYRQEFFLHSYQAVAVNECLQEERTRA